MELKKVINQYTHYKGTYRIVGIILLVALLLLQQSLANQLENLNDPVHLSWTTKQTRYDIIFSLKGPLKNVIKLDNTAANYLANASSSCTGFEACLIQDGKHIFSYNLEPTGGLDKNLFKSVNKTSTSNETIIEKNSKTVRSCKKSSISLKHYCSTHWNPPAHFSGAGCNHALEWHSPYSCPPTTINYARPCYVYDTNGSLIDLSSWILTNSNGYTVDVSAKEVNESVKHFTLNVCNEAQFCGPNVAACYIGQNGHVESGYNNLTSINYDAKEKVVRLTTLGQYNEQCPDQRVKTVVMFVCKNKLISKRSPRLLRFSPCESIIEWETIHACPITETRAPATNCSIKYQPLDQNIEIMKLTNNVNLVEVPDVYDKVKDKKMTMMLGICQGISSKILACEGKSTSTTAACLIEPTSSKDHSSTTERNSTNSQVIGTISKSFLRYSDDRLYLESQSMNKSCTYSQGLNFNATRQISTRLEFYCSPKQQDKPNFLSFDDCVYVFEWGTPLMCFETSKIETIKNWNEDSSSVSSSTSISSKKSTEERLKINLDEKPKTSIEMHSETLKDAKTVSDNQAKPTKEIPKPALPESKKLSDHKNSSAKQTDTNTSNTENDKKTDKTSTVEAEPKRFSYREPSRMNKLHKFFMICLIIMSIAGFIVLIFVLDKKTKLRIPLGNMTRQTRQSFQPQPVPYTRVDQFSDLDL